MTRSNAKLEALHDHYVEAVNIAVAGDDYDSIDRLVAEYDRELLAFGAHRADLRAA